MLYPLNKLPMRRLSGPGKTIHYAAPQRIPILGGPACLCGIGVDAENYPPAPDTESVTCQECLAVVCMVGNATREHDEPADPENQA